MPNDPKADLIYAILAMDAYSRGYGRPLSGLEETGAIGNWTIGTNAFEQFGSDAFNAGFYAIAYRNTATNEVVIPYRGTDFNGNWPSLGVVSRASHTRHSSS
jgi:hypothetical protein